MRNDQITLFICVFVLMSCSHIAFASESQMENILPELDLVVKAEDTLDLTVPNTLPSDLVLNQKKLIHDGWILYEKYYREKATPLLRAGDSMQLYFIQFYTHNYLIYAGTKNDDVLLDKILQLYLDTLQYLEVNEKGEHRWIYRNATVWPGTQYPNLLGQEVQLYNSQFMAVVAKAMHIVGDKIESQRTETQKAFLVAYTPIAVEFYERWCKIVQPRFEILLRAGPNLNKSTNAVWDGDMWILTGVTDFLVVQKSVIPHITLTSEQEKLFYQLVDTGSKLLESRITKSQLTDFSGNAVEGINFDLGEYDDLIDNQYSGYTGTDYPKDIPPQPASNVGWDISHALRFVFVFNTLYENKNILGQGFPSREILVGLANQFIYGVFNKNFENPLFTNYMDGTNGWFRVSPTTLSGASGPYAVMYQYSVPAFGYGYWTQFNSDMMKILMRLFELMNGRNTDGVTQNWQIKINGQNPSITLGSFLSSLLTEQLPISFSIENPPIGFSINSQTGKIIWTPDSTQTGKHYVKVKVSNGFQEIIQTVGVLVTEKVSQPSPAPTPTPTPLPDTTPDPSLPTPTPNPDPTPTPTPTPPPPPGGTNGLCATTLNSCKEGSFSDTEDTSTKYNWSCLGLNGGYTASCSLDRFLPPINNTPPNTNRPTNTSTYRPGQISTKINYQAPTINIPTTTVDISMPQIPSWLDFITAFILDIVSDIIRGVKRTGEMVGI
jgi:hypothetical protein